MKPMPFFLSNTADSKNVLKQIGDLDIGQAVIVQHGVILGIEGAEGTDQLMNRCAHLHREGVGGVLVKGRKTGQEDRIDLPDIWLHTIQIAAKCKLQGIAIEAGGVFIFERHKMIGLADESDLFVIGVWRWKLKFTISCQKTNRRKYS